MTLAVCVPVIGMASETFIRRHATELAPGETVVIARRRAPEAERAWDVDGPVLLLDDLVDEWGDERERSAVAAFVSEHGVRSVLTEFLDVWAPFVATLRASGARCVAHGHGYDVTMRLRDPWWRSEYSAYAGFDRVVTMSQISCERLVTEVGLPADRVIAVPYGVDVPRTPAMRTQSRTVQCLAVGRMVAKKAPQQTASAFAQAAGLDPALRLTMVGDGPLLGEVRELVERLGIGDRIDLVGAQDNPRVLELMEASDIFVQHSVVDPDTGDEEGMPVAILEAMARSLPVVSTRHAGIPEAVEDEGSGLLVDEGDVAGMATAIGRLAEDPQLRVRMGARGYEIARSRFSWEAERAALRTELGLAPTS